VSELQSRLGRSQTGTDVYNGSMELAIESASRFIDEKTGRVFYSKTITTEYIDQYGLSDNGFWISSFFDKIYAPAPIISVSSLVVDNVTFVANTDYYLDKQMGVISTDDSLSSSRRGNALSCVIGCSAIPLDIKQICISIAEIFSGLGKMTIQDYSGGMQEIQKTTIPKDILKMLEKYRWFTL
jgi:hypothetical protein